MPGEFFVYGGHGNPEIHMRTVPSAKRVHF